MSFSVSSSPCIFPAHTPPRVFPLRMTFRYGHRLMWLIKARDQGVTGASPDVSFTLPLSAERTHSQEPGGDHWKLFIWSTDKHTQAPSPAQFKTGIKDMIVAGCICTERFPDGLRSVPGTWRCKDMKVCQSSVCVCVCAVVFSQHLDWSERSPERRQRDEMRTNKCRRRGSSQQCPVCWSLKRRKQAGQPSSPLSSQR